MSVNLFVDLLKSVKICGRLKMFLKICGGLRLYMEVYQTCIFKWLQTAGRRRSSKLIQFHCSVYCTYFVCVKSPVPCTRHCALQCEVCTVHGALYNVKCVQCTMHCTTCTLQHVLYTAHS